MVFQRDSENSFWLNILILKITSVWPLRFGVHNLLFIIVFLSALTSVTGTIREVLIKIEDPTAFVEYTIASIDTICFVYMRWIFLKNQSKIQFLLNVRQIFRRFCPLSKIISIEEEVLKFTKIFFIYCLMGNLINSLFALYDREGCDFRRTSDIYRERDPCGLISRSFFPFDISGYPTFYLVYVYQIYTTTMLSTAVLISTITQLGIIQHAIAQLSYCRQLISELQMESRHLEEQLKFIIMYHVKIIGYVTRMNEAFSNMMVLHLTVTPLIISVLGFEILIVGNIADASRYAVHLSGWIFLLGLSSFYGQKLIDESLALAHDIYFSPWYLANFSAQKHMKMILMRSQYPLELSVANLQNMSLETFLIVMKTAYSYFTLLLNLK